jgi:antibiotic biosynthesis monooxygenase (ABM) superfamily enzyme
MTRDPSVTVLVTRRILEGREAEHEAWVHDVSQVASAFPGHQGVHLVRPRDGSRVYSLVFRFASAAQLDGWEASPERRAWVARADELCQDTRVQHLTGMEGWFGAPPGALGPPPRWKMAVVSFGVAFPTIQTLQVLLSPALAPLPSPVRGAIVGLAMVLFMTYIAMPFVTRRLSTWLYPGPVA